MIFFNQFTGDPPHNRANLHTTEHRAATGHFCPVVCHHFREHGRRGQRYKRLFLKQIFGLQPISDLKAPFAVCDYLHKVSHIIWSRMTLYTAGHLHTAVTHCSHSRAPIVHTAVPRENNEHGCVYLRCRAVCKLPGCVEGHPWWLIMNRNRKACLAYINNVCLRMLGCVHCARLCAFLLGCVLCLARLVLVILVLVIDGKTVYYGVYHNNYMYLHQHD